MSSVGVVILAAGASRRLGTPKQLLQYQGGSLIQRVVATAIAAVGEPIIVVLGANAAQIQAELQNVAVQVVINPEWIQGLSASIRTGIETLLTVQPEVAAVVLLVCDQPLISHHFIQQLVTTYRQTEQPIVASEYAGVVGVPALFDRRLFPALIRLNGDRGAKPILQQYSHSLQTVSCPDAACDIDTPIDYTQLLQEHQRS
ncbi:nucleotidyltransferase family protein [Pantanalinema rosaneae CENA516]|uniref:nucleotidyltransferase family protein n=1 Tax=Pantanalinema rosaneae TaxID=1620701 RepID=UPI003D6EDCE4